MEQLANQKILVLGLGVSGRNAANFCVARGASVLAADERSQDHNDEIEGLDPRVERLIGQPFPDSRDFDLVVPSPGIPAERYRDRARRVWGDIELAYQFLGAPIIAVTGTNGKSTTVRLLEAMLRAAGARARAAGNLGTSALELIGQPLDFAILEVSSFQLETVETFRPAISVLLNITPDHLDRHGSFEAYAAAKARMIAHQRDPDTAVLNLDDPAVAALAATTRARLFPFQVSGPLARGAYLDTDTAVLCEPDASTLRIPLDQMRLTGIHNRANVLAALAATHAAGVDPVRAAAALASFTGLPHRSEFVRELDGVRYVNDSKATNPGAALRSLTGYSETLVWIAGGRDKDLEFDELAETAVHRARAAVLIGEGAGKLEAALQGRIEVHNALSLEEAVQRAAILAKPGDVVLLSPACASQDQFRDFEERGECFRAAVARLRGSEAR
jgi:UDP-N-acetylmuramoylalanine--D-glutamate ligase